MERRVSRSAPVWVCLLFAMLACLSASFGTARGDAGDLLLSWSRPSLDPDHGEPVLYRIYRSESPSGGFILVDEIDDPSSTVGYTDGGAVGPPAILFYEVIASNAAGVSDTLP